MNGTAYNDSYLERITATQSSPPLSALDLRRPVLSIAYWLPMALPATQFSAPFRQCIIILSSFAAPASGLASTERCEMPNSEGIVNGPPRMVVVAHDQVRSQRAVVGGEDGSDQPPSVGEVMVTSKMVARSGRSTVTCYDLSPSFTLSLILYLV